MIYKSKPILSFNFNFSVGLIPQPNIEFHVKLTTKFPLVKLYWTVKKGVTKGKSVNEGVSSVPILKYRYKWNSNNKFKLLHPW